MLINMPNKWVIRMLTISLWPIIILLPYYKGVGTCERCKLYTNQPLSISIRSETICRRTSTKSQRTVAAETTHTHRARAAARRTKGRERRLRDVLRPQGSPSSLEADNSLPPRPPPPPTRASSSRLFLIFFPTRSGPATCTLLSILHYNATVNAFALSDTNEHEATDPRYTRLSNDR